MSSSPPSPAQRPTPPKHRASGSSQNTSESSRASQLSGYDDDDYEELTQRIFYKPEGEDEAVVPIDLTGPTLPSSISQTLGAPIAKRLIEQETDSPEEDEEGLDITITNTSMWQSSRASTSTGATPSRWSFRPTPLFRHEETSEPGSQPPTPVTTPTHHSHLDPTPESPEQDESSPIKETVPEPELEATAEDNVIEIPDVHEYPRVKLSPPPPTKRKSGSQGSSPSPSPPSTAQLPPSPSIGLVGQPISPTPMAPSASRHVRFLSSWTLDKFPPSPSSSPSPPRRTPPRTPPRTLYSAQSPISSPGSSTSNHLPSPPPLPPLPLPLPLRPLPPPPPPSPPPKPASKIGKIRQMNTHQTMFIFGFLFPWCWLIGGWLLPLTSPSSPMTPSAGRLRHKRGGSLLPIHRSGGDENADEASTNNRQLRRDYSLTVSSHQRYRHDGMSPSSRAQWGRRCRIAAGFAAVVFAGIIAVAIWGAVTR